VEDQRDGIVQCTMCKSEGAVPMELRDLVKSLITKIRMLQKQKVFLQKKLRETSNGRSI